MLMSVAGASDPGAIHTVDADVDHLRIANVRERNGNYRGTDRYVARADATATHAARAAGNLRLRTARYRHIAREGHYRRKVVRATRGPGFNSRAASEHRLMKESPAAPWVLREIAPLTVGPQGCKM